ncbi:MAG TPA: hypothetical protein VK576_01460 [Thermoleophilia bacterium]|nr:hypothetical protein [Thermoleophilia bacterium]
MRRLVFWLVVLLTIAAVAFGVWYYVRDDYPFQVTAGEIRGLTYQAGTEGLVFSGTIATPPSDLADWLSSMEQDSSDQPLRPVGVATVRLVGGRSLRLAVDLDARLALGRWVSPGGVEGATTRVHIGQGLAWYLRGVHDGLVERSQSGPAATSPSPAGAPQSASPSP